MRSLHDIRLFVQVAQNGSISGVARNLNMTTAAISMALKRLEKDIGSRLMIRSTRSLRLTDEGEIFYSKAIEALATLDQAVEQINERQNALLGRLKVSVPSDLGRNVLLPWINDFMALHPRVEIQLYTTDVQSDVYSQPIDIAFRYGKLPDSNLIAVCIAPHNHRILVASPAYIAQRGEPSTPQDLLNHDCISFMRNERVYDDWEFGADLTKNAHHQKVRVNCARVANDGDVVKRWTLDGYGISYRSFLDVSTEVLNGELVAVCPHWGYQILPLNMIYTDRRQITILIGEFRQFVTQKFHHLQQGLMR